jgi:hypothetical protein
MPDAKQRYGFRARGFLTRAERWLYPGGRPNGLARLLNRGWAIVHGTGLLPQRYVTLEVPGRRTGRMLSFPLVIADYQGERDLVSMLGERSSWSATSAPPVDEPCCAMAGAGPCAWRRSTPTLGRRSCAATCRSRPDRGPSSRSIATPRSRSSRRSLLRSPSFACEAT